MVAARSAAERARDGFARARSLAAWKSKVREHWGEVSVLGIDGDVTAARVGDERTVAVRVRLAELSTDDVTVHDTADQADAERLLRVDAGEPRQEVERAPLRRQDRPRGALQAGEHPPGPEPLTLLDLPDHLGRGVERAIGRARGAVSTGPCSR